MANLVIEIDATEIVNAYKKGFEDCFAMMVNDEELQSELNKNSISTDE